MPLTLVLGPANSAKAGEVLGTYAAAAARGALLVVPTHADAEHYTRELVSAGALLGTVTTFSGLVGEIARRVGLAARALTAHQRGRLLARAVTGAGLQRLQEAARAPGFAGAAGEMIAELQRTLVTPARFASALTAWAGADEARAAYGRELAALYFAYRRELERVGALDRDLLAWRALDALRSAPGAWGQGSVFFYGFDDLNPLQRDAVETLAGPVGVQVTVSLTYEPGRGALAARAEAVEALRPLATDVTQLPAVDDYYAPESRTALHHLERHLFEPGAPRVPAYGAVGLLEAGGERAEAELVAAEILALVQTGVPAEEIAVVLRAPEAGAGVLVGVFDQYGIAWALHRRVPLSHTRLGRGLLALARCALAPELTPAGDLVDYLRVPGVGDGLDAADRLEAEVMRRGLRTAAAARERLQAPLPELDAVAAAPDPAAELAVQARRLLGAAARRGAPVFDGAGELDARACAAVVTGVSELRAVEPETPVAELIVWLAELPVEAGRPARPGAVLIADPLSIRARRFAAVVVAGLQEGTFPRGPIPDPFLPDEVRRELAAASGLRLALAEDPLVRERYLFYACASRATQRLVLSYRSSDEEGNLALPSPFLRDVADLLDEDWWERRRRRLLADVVFSPDEAPTPYERRRALAAAGTPAPTGTAASAGAPVQRRLSPAALAHVRHSEVVSAGALETFADCPVSWLVSRQLRPEPLTPTPEPLARGSFMHEVLERVLGALGGPVTPETLPEARALLERHLGPLPADIAPGSPPGVRAAALRMIAADLHRYLEAEAASGADWRPVAFEQRFGFDDDPASLPPLELVEGEERVRVRGAIDRIDVDRSGQRAIVRDYKSGGVRPEYQAGKWSDEGSLQVALYMLAVRELTGREPVAGLYQPLRGQDLRPRGAYRTEAVPMSNLFSGDGRAPDELDALLDDARARAIALAARLRSGELVPCPSTCSRDGCRHPGICRSA